MPTSPPSTTPSSPRSNSSFPSITTSHVSWAGTAFDTLSRPNSSFHVSPTNLPSTTTSISTSYSKGSSGFTPKNTSSSRPVSLAAVLGLNVEKDNGEISSQPKEIPFTPLLTYPGNLVLKNDPCPIDYEKSSKLKTIPASSVTAIPKSRTGIGATSSPSPSLASSKSLSSSSYIKQPPTKQPLPTMLVERPRDEYFELSPRPIVEVLDFEPVHANFIKPKVSETRSMF